MLQPRHHQAKQHQPNPNHANDSVYKVPLEKKNATEKNSDETVFPKGRGENPDPCIRYLHRQ